MKKEEIIAKYGERSLRNLPFAVCKVENQIFRLTLLGETSTKRMKNLRYKRNVLRKLLLDKLKVWEENPDSCPEMTYKDALVLEEKLKHDKWESEEE